MFDLLSVTITGRCVKQPELTKNEKGLSTITFVLAVDRNDKKKDSGEYGERVSYIDFTLFGSDAENLHQWLTKGTFVTVEGHVEQERWETSEGKKASRLKLIPDHVIPFTPSMPKENPNRTPYIPPLNVENTKPFK